MAQARDVDGSWKAHMRDIARRVREARTLVGVSQESLALDAGVSQGAVSRLESGRGLATPLWTYVKIVSALDAKLARLGGESGLGLPSGPNGAARIEPDVATLLRAYHALPPRARDGFASVMAAVSGALEANLRRDA